MVGEGARELRFLLLPYQQIKKCWLNPKFNQHFSLPLMGVKSYINVGANLVSPLYSDVF